MGKSNYIPSISFHPGGTLAEKMKEMGLTVENLARRTSISERVIIAIIKGGKQCHS